jgi:hypothetical protein
MKLRALLAAAALACCSVSVAALPAQTAAANAPLRTPEADRRTPDQTWLTFPEWFLVFSPADYAEGLAANQPASAFPFFRHVREFWQAYGRVIDATRGKYPFNGEYHTMIAVIGVSTTVEYGLKGSYETLIGRLSELTAAPNATPEDRLATRVAQDYVTFIRVRPWYEFDFVTPLRQLWSDTPMFGAGMVRKWERRYLLTSEWAIKAAYAAALEQATHSAFAVPKTSTLVVVDNLPADFASTDTIVVRERRDTQALLELPRYQAFTDAALQLSRAGVRFREIAGNDGLVLLSVVVPAAKADDPGARVMTRQDVLSRPGHQRRVLEVPVPQLAAVLAAHAAAGDGIEHVFDY